MYVMHKRGAVLLLVRLVITSLLFSCVCFLVSDDIYIHLSRLIEQKCSHVTQCAL